MCSFNLESKPFPPIPKNVKPRITYSSTVPATNETTKKTDRSRVVRGRSRATTSSGDCSHSFGKWNGNILYGSRRSREGLCPAGTVANWFDALPE
jgi:hypothetical protein